VSAARRVGLVVRVDTISVRRARAPVTPSPLRVVRWPDCRYARTVTERTRALLSNALRLTVDERAELAADLLASLHDEPDHDVETAWAAEIERRARSVMQEGSRGRRWEQVRDLRRRS
jgi:putative addiction module component (TIGR02574 family)